MTSPSLISAHVVVREPARAAELTLQSLVTQTHPAMHIVLVDNASQDREVSWSRFGHREVMVLRNFRDQGFARAHNQALASLYARWPQDTWDGRYIALLSSRVTLAADALQELASVLDQYPDCMAVAPKVRRVFLQAGEDVERPECVDAGIIEQAGLVFSSASELVFRGQGEKDEGQYDEGSASVLPGTFCLLVRASALMKAKLAHEWLDADLPETYAMMDVVWRLHLLQMPMQYVPRALAWVQTSAYEPVGAWARVRRWYDVEHLQDRAARSYAGVLRVKNAAWGRIFLALPWLFLVSVRRFFEALVDPRVIPLMVRAWLAFVPALGKRRFLQVIRRV